MRWVNLGKRFACKAYAQINPLREYKEVGFQKFETMVQAIENDATKYINRAQIRDNLQREDVIKPTGTSSGKDDDSHRKTPARSTKVGRNDPCPCGSGKNIKLLWFIIWKIMKSVSI